VNIKDIANKSGYTLFDSPVWKMVAVRYTENIIRACMEEIQSLEYPSGSDAGKLANGSTWSYALSTAQQKLEAELSQLRSDNGKPSNSR